MAKKKDNYTINDLAIAVAKGFEEVNENFDKKFSQLNKKIEDEISSVRSDIGHKIDSLGFKMQVEFRNVEKRIDALEMKIDQGDKLSKADILAIGDEVYHIKLRTKKLEQKIAKLKLAS